MVHRLWSNVKTAGTLVWACYQEVECSEELRSARSSAKEGKSGSRSISRNTELY